MHMLSSHSTLLSLHVLNYIFDLVYIELNDRAPIACCALTRAKHSHSKSMMTTAVLI